MKNLFLITGEEVYERNECLEKIKLSFGELVKGINYIVLDKDTISSLESEIDTYPFGFSQKLIVVKLDKKSTKDEEEDKKQDFLTDSLIETLENLDDSVGVVFIGDFTLKSKIYKLVEKNGKCFNFEKKKENELINWCREIFDENEIKISNQDISYLINLAGTEKLVFIFF